MAKCLKFNGFFSTGAGSGGDRSADFVFIASLLLRHLQECPSSEHCESGNFLKFAKNFYYRLSNLSNVISSSPHMQIASTNGLEMAECILKNNDVTKFDIIPVGGAIFPTMSFYNHSCYPNAQRLGYQVVIGPTGSIRHMLPAAKSYMPTQERHFLLQ